MEETMSRKLMLIVSTLLISIFAFSAAFAMGGGNARKGKFLYRKNCRSCHGTSASDLSPSSKTQAQWTATFADTGKIQCSGDWTISEQDLNDIFTYLHDYASDSPSPAKCS
ncbi:Cytochrome c family protein [Pseudodesulfovibrio profundus]|uniref:Cytochrome c family protein n=2 Tax=Pseudodesulfovibrio profundus TaxID=57320 RepID=A0A2C8F861_9BACT|nr:Cytochrome c family protein [Pseudodesulfovibrio profundus]